LTDDGTFFPTPEEAAFHEAEQHLIGAAMDLGVDPDKLMRVIDGCDKEIECYITAYRHARDKGVGRFANLSGPDTEGGDEAASQLVFSLGWDSDVSDMGSGVMAEAVADQGQSHGVGGGSTTAPSLRSGEGMA